jgi:hypothetical protein
MRVEIPRVPLIVGLFVILEAVVLWLFAQEPSDRRRAVYAFAGTILAGAFALYVYLRGMEDKRTDSAGYLIERWNSPDRYELKKIMKMIADEKLDPATLSRKKKGDDQTEEVREQRLKVTAMLNFYEEMAISVKERSVNEDKLYDFFSNVLEDAYARLFAYIETERRIDASAAYFCEMEWLAKRWRQRTQNPRS